MEVYLDDTPRPPFIFGILLAKTDDFVVGHILIEIVDGMFKMDVVGEMASLEQKTEHIVRLWVGTIFKQAFLELFQFHW